MYKVATRVAFIVATLMVIAGAVMWFLQDKDEKEKPEAKETVKPVVMMSTNGVQDNIERRLTQREGRAIKAECPAKVNQEIGTKFTCDVFFTGREDAIAIANVVIDGPNGEFSWKSEAKIKGDA
ncbi:hypothetical protein GCM10022234_30570 [Aeromicrobium panaciterrae]|uniref:hypothetical protein n=1 Tax=Aeromicrobium panaciterrae TaxID=363861 RepID=UPI0031CE1F52